MNEQDSAQFSEYFQLNHAIEVNISKGDVLSNTPTDDEFDTLIPLPYKLASEMKGVEQNMLRPLRQLGDVIEPLADYLKAQSRKIDLMMHYILQAQDENDDRHLTVSFGGGGFIFSSPDSYSKEDYLVCKLFFNDEASAIYCLGRVIEQSDNDKQGDEGDEGDERETLYTVLFHKIRDEDRETVVRASLHQQSKQLLKKTQKRDSENS
ncbi:PilZ domain-containing protein [Psychrosphaera haliotis]|uniref:PilZ domain-containing protein n=1 Tax=Psychrosphaera haliotis TaxID=555083 RepID=A0A6N8F544_9GAMM|nr:PilZ domain-containing protein [Psychrosphaera haliotis]MUH71685.1 PilZ domain-containing protein [Psychrosphaera haliotis]